MKKLILLLFIPLLTFLGCGVAGSLQGSANSSNWYPVEMRPSQIKYNGDYFYTKKINKTEYIVVYYDESLDADDRYYNNKLWESYGWTIGDKMTASQYASSPRSSTLHISVKRGVAVYLNPESQFAVFRVVRTTSPFGDSID
jgi:hypothetical protein